MSTIKADAITAVTADTPVTITGAGTGKVRLGDANLLWPDADGGSSGDVLQTNGSGTLSFATPAGGAWNVLATVDASTSSSLAFESNIDSTYNTYCIGVEALTISANQSIEMTVGTGGTPTYASSLYVYHVTRLTSTSAAYASDTSNSDTDMQLATEVASDASLDGANISGLIYFNNPSVATELTWFNWSLVHTQEAAGIRMIKTLGAGGWNTVTAITAVKLATASTNFATGKLVLYGIANS